MRSGNHLQAFEAYFAKMKFVYLAYEEEKKTETKVIHERGQKEEGMASITLFLSCFHQDHILEMTGISFSLK